MLIIAYTKMEKKGISFAPFGMNGNKRNTTFQKRKDESEDLKKPGEKISATEAGGATSERGNRQKTRETALQSP